MGCKMYSSIIKYLVMVIVFIFCNSNLTFAKDKTIEEEIKSFSKIGKRYRITVSEFKNTAGSITKYDGYIADSIIHQLSNYKNFKLIERQRLKAVLKELEFSSSGVISSDQALKIGDMLPVDIIGTGSYTILGKLVKVNGRFINVVSGEIVHTIAYSFAADIVVVSTPAENKHLCEKIKDDVLNAFKNLNGEENINKAVMKAISVPFDINCGRVHLDVIRIFRKYKIFPPKYREFLLKTLSKIENPIDDRRALIIIDHLADDEKVDNEEWKAGLEIVKKSGKIRLKSYLADLFNNKVEKDSVVRERIDQVIKLAKRKKIGRPIAFDQSTIFFSVISALDSYRHRKLENLLYVFENYSSMIKDNEKYNNKAFEVLKKKYFDEKDLKLKNRTFKNLLTFLKDRKKTKRVARYLFYMVEKMERQIKKNKTKEIYIQDLKTINKELLNWFCYIIKNPEYPLKPEDVKKYFDRNGITCK